MITDEFTKTVENRFADFLEKWRNKGIELKIRVYDTQSIELLYRPSHKSDDFFLALTQNAKGIVVARWLLASVWGCEIVDDRTLYDDSFLRFLDIAKEFTIIARDIPLDDGTEDIKADAIFGDEQMPYNEQSICDEQSLDEIVGLFANVTKKFASITHKLSLDDTLSESDKKELNDISNQFLNVSEKLGAEEEPHLSTDALIEELDKIGFKVDFVNNENGGRSGRISLKNTKRPLCIGFFRDNAMGATDTYYLLNTVQLLEQDVQQKVTNLLERYSDTPLKNR